MNTSVRHRIGRTSVAALLAIAAAGGVALAASSNASAVGASIMVDPCPSGTTGPTGSTGPTGETGPTGATTLAYGRAGFWRFCEPPMTTTLTDSSGNGNDGVYAGGVALGQTGIPGAAPNTAALFDGINDSGQVPDDPTLDVGTSFTVEGWIKRSVTNKTQQMMVKGNGFQLVVMNAGSGNQVWLRKANVTTLARSITPILADGMFHHVAATQDGPGDVHIYIDGVESTVVLNTVHAAGDTAFPLTFGLNNSGAGTFDEFGLWDDELDACEIQYLYYAGSGAVGSGCAG